MKVHGIRQLKNPPLMIWTYCGLFRQEPNLSWTRNRKAVTCKNCLKVMKGRVWP